MFSPRGGSGYGGGGGGGFSFAGNLPPPGRATLAGVAVHPAMMPGTAAHQVCPTRDMKLCPVEDWCNDGAPAHGNWYPNQQHAAVARAGVTTINSIQVH